MESESEVSKRGWREATNRGPKCSKNCSPDLCSASPKGAIGKTVQQRGQNLWHRKDFPRANPLCLPTPF